jgi:hypothetical protein
MYNRVTLQDDQHPNSDEDEETAIQRVIQQLTEEAALDGTSGFNIPEEPAPGSQAQPCKAETEGPQAEEELPWCCICNEDATLHGAGCDGDLYCAQGFWKGQDNFDLKEHQTSPYHPQPPCQEH